MPDLTCAFCEGDFLEIVEDDSNITEWEGNQTANGNIVEEERHRRRVVPKSFARPYHEAEDDCGIIPHLYFQGAVKEEKVEEDFAWVPPTQHFQAFLPDDDKLVHMDDGNKFRALYVEDKDDFPSLETIRSTVKTLQDSRIVEKEKMRRFERRRSVSNSWTDSSSTNDGDEAHLASSAPITSFGPTPHEKLARKREKRRETLKLRKQQVRV